MSSMSSVAGLSKYITTLPKKETTTLLIVIISFITGALYFLISPFYPLNIPEAILFGGCYGFGLLGISSILTGGLQQYEIELFNGINVKIKHSMFLSFISMIIVSLFIIIGSLFSYMLNTNLFLSTLIFGCVITLGMNIIIIRSTSKLSFKKSSFIGLTHPALALVMYVILFIFTNEESPITQNFIPFLLKVVVASIVLIIAIYSFIKIIESPMRKNLGIGVLDLLSYFIAHINEGSHSLEGLFDSMGESIETIVSFISFKNNDGIKSLFISPCVHPGPLGDIGGSNMPTILANKFNNFTMVAHGSSTHDFNPVSISEIDKIEDAVKKGLKRTEYSSKASKFIRYHEKKSNIGVQFFNEGMIILSTFAPEGSDDIEFGVGLTMMAQSLSVCKVKDSVIVDCHNSFTPESGGVLPGNPEVFELINLISRIEKNEEEYLIKVGTYSDNMEEFTSNEGVGESGLKIMIVEVGNQRTAYVLFDANNMKKGYRAEIIEAVKDLDIDEIEVMTTDTHSVNTLSRGYNPIGTSKREEIIKYVKKGIEIAINDLEYVEVGTGTERIKNLKTFGPNNSTELISTISSIVAVSKIIAPLLFVTAIILVFIWIFFIS